MMEHNLLNIFVTTKQWSSGHHVWFDARLKQGTSIEVRWGDGSKSILTSLQTELSRVDHYYKKFESEETYQIEFWSESPEALIEFHDGTREMTLNRLDFLICPALRKIYISHMPETDFSNCPELRELECRSYCKTLDLRSAPELRKLSCTGSGFLEKLILTGNDKLEILECQVNPRLTKVALSNNSSLRRLTSYMTEIDDKSYEWIGQALERNNRQSKHIVIRKELKDIETKIIAITSDNLDKSDFLMRNPENRRTVQLLLEKRRHILNRMFRPTKDNMQRFKAVNEHLHSLTQQLRNRVKTLEAKQPIIMDCPDFDDDYEIEGTLRYSFNSKESVLMLNDDEHYGSNFTLMIKLISDLSYDTVNANIEYIHFSSTNLDDGQSWNEYPFTGRKEFNDIVICHAVHQLTDHQLYSIPDLIRLNDFWAEVHLTLQSVTEQDGTRFNKTSV